MAGSSAINTIDNSPINLELLTKEEQYRLNKLPRGSIVCTDVCKCHVFVKAIDSPKKQTHFCKFPGGSEKCRNDTRGGGESPEHKAVKKEIMRLYGENGYECFWELVDETGERADVVTYKDGRSIGHEVQVSHKSPRDIAERSERRTAVYDDIIWWVHENNKPLIGFLLSSVDVFGVFSFTRNEFDIPTAKIELKNAKLYREGLSKKRQHYLGIDNLPKLMGEANMRCKWTNSWMNKYSCRMCKNCKKRFGAQQILGNLGYIAEINEGDFVNRIKWVLA